MHITESLTGMYLSLLWSIHILHMILGHSIKTPFWKVTTMTRHHQRSEAHSELSVGKRHSGWSSLCKCTTVWCFVFFLKFIVTYKQCGRQNININNTAEKTAFLISRGIIGVQGKMSYSAEKICFHSRCFSHWNHRNYIMLQQSYNYSAENAV